MAMPVKRARGHLEAAARFMAAQPGGYEIVEAGPEDSASRMRQEVLAGLAARPQKWISPTYFYDATGSRLFERLTALEEYYPARCEAALLGRVAPVIARLVGAREVVELGSGSSAKTRAILEAMGATRRSLRYVPIDVSRTMLREAAGHLVRAYPRLTVLALAGRYEEALAALAPSGDRLYLFLGGTIGNFTPDFQAGFFQRLAGTMLPGNHLLLGYSRRPHAAKPISVILRAYNDEAGLTARFNLNLLARLNRELGANFQLAQWRHRAIYNPTAHQVEMYLDAQAAQEIVIPGGARCRFARGEALLTELSRRFDPGSLAASLAESGLRMVERWSDEAGYCDLLLVRRA